MSRSADDRPEPHCGHSPSAEVALLADSQLHDAAALFAALADPERLRLLLQLADGERCVSELSGPTAKFSTVSARLKTLSAARLVSRRREARHIYYALADAHVSDLLHTVLEHVSETHTGPRS